MGKKIKLTKKQQKKLSKSWLGILVLLAIFGYNFYQDHKIIAPGERFEVTLDRCIDGDTAWFYNGDEKIKVRFLYIDTPESTRQIEPYGKEAKEYTKKLLTEAMTIELEWNEDGDRQDKYGRYLAWVFVDGELLQEKIAREGLVEKFYDYGYEYTYKGDVIAADEEAKRLKKGIYQTD